MRRLGIDHGMRRVGVAVSDDEGRIAYPRTTLARKDPKALVEAVVALAQEEGVGEIIVGLPLTLEGRETASARRARAFATRVEQSSGLPIVMWDERLTTAAAERSLATAGVQARKQKAVVDQVAASLILQAYLDMLAARAER
ncbi:MAG: Holliday junction resolvase RuvX [Sandaracinaceae bacterium]